MTTDLPQPTDSAPGAVTATGTPPKPTHAPKHSPGSLSASLLRRVGRSWLALELGAGILALALLVALLPLVVIAFPAYLGRTIPLWAIATDVLAVSVPLAAILGAAALRLAGGTLSG